MRIRLRLVFEPFGQSKCKTAPVSNILCTSTKFPFYFFQWTHSNRHTTSSPVFSQTRFYAQGHLGSLWKQRSCLGYNSEQETSSGESFRWGSEVRCLQTNTALSWWLLITHLLGGGKLYQHPLKAPQCGHQSSKSFESRHSSSHSLNHQLHSAQEFEGWELCVSFLC